MIEVAGLVAGRILGGDVEEFFDVDARADEFRLGRFDGGQRVAQFTLGVFQLLLRSGLQVKHPLHAVARFLAIAALRFQSRQFDLRLLILAARFVDIVAMHPR